MRAGTQYAPVRHLKWIVAQAGMREHYAVARAFHAFGCLEHLYTDLWCGHGRAFLLRGPAIFRAFAGRHHSEMPPELVTSFNLSSLVGRFPEVSPWKCGRRSDPSLEYVRLGKLFGQAVASRLRKFPLASQTHAFFGYCTQALEVLELARERNILSIVDQIHPARVEEEIVFAEQNRWPDWEKGARRNSEEYWKRLEDEWRAASIVLVNSRWSKSALISQGVPAHKLVVVPLVFEAAQRVEKKINRREQLTVLWLGTVGLRKGIAYLLRAASALISENVQFLIAGPIGITADAIATAPPNVRFLGRVTLDRAAALYLSADVFVLPTLSDGFALTQVEAMAYGLPVIATECCGDVVDDGVNGFIVPPRDSVALAEKLLKLERDRELLAEQSRRALIRAGEFSIKSFVRRLEAEVSSLPAEVTQ